MSLLGEKRRERDGNGDEILYYSFGLGWDGILRRGRSREERTGEKGVKRSVRECFAHGFVCTNSVK